MAFNVGGTDYFPTQENVSLKDPTLLTGINEPLQGDVITPPEIDKGFSSIPAINDPGIYLPQQTAQGYHVPALDRDISQSSQRNSEQPGNEPTSYLTNKPKLNIWKELGFWQKQRILAMPPSQAKALSEYMYTQRLNPLTLEFTKKHTEALRAGRFDIAEALEQEYAPFAAKVPQYNTLLRGKAEERNKIYSQHAEVNAISDLIIQNRPEGSTARNIAEGLKLQGTKISPSMAMQLIQGSDVKVDINGNQIRLVDPGTGKVIATSITPTGVSVADIPEAKKNALTYLGIDPSRYAYLQSKVNQDDPSVTMTGPEIREYLDIESKIGKADSSGLNLTQKMQSIPPGTASTFLQSGTQKKDIAELYNNTQEINTRNYRQQAEDEKRARSQAKSNVKQLNPLEVIAQDAIRTRANQLAAQGRNFDDIYNQLYLEGFIDANGRPILHRQRETQEITPDTFNTEPLSENEVSDITSNTSQGGATSTPPSQSLPAQAEIDVAPSAQSYQPEITQPQSSVNNSNLAQADISDSQRKHIELEQLKQEAQARGREAGNQAEVLANKNSIPVRLGKNGRIEIGDNTQTFEQAKAKGFNRIIRADDLSKVRDVEAVQNSIDDLLKLYKDEKIPRSDKEGAGKALTELAVTGLNIPIPLTDSSLPLKLPSSTLTPGQRKIFDQAALLKSQMSSLLDKSPNADIGVSKRSLNAPFSTIQSAISTLETWKKNLARYNQGFLLLDNQEDSSTKDKADKPKVRFKILKKEE